MNTLKYNCSAVTNYHTKYIALHLPSLIIAPIDFRRSRTVQKFMLSLRLFQNLLEIFFFYTFRALFHKHYNQQSQQ